VRQPQGCVGLGILLDEKIPGSLKPDTGAPAALA